MTDWWKNPVADALFAALDPTQGQGTALAQTALSRGADLALNNDYAGAAREFRRSIALDPSEANVIKASDLLATAYTQQNLPEEAIKAYKSAISMAPTDDSSHAKLGNLYFGEKRYTEAEAEYAAAVRLNPTSTANILSLGQVYLATGRDSEAEAKFQQITRMEPQHYGGHYALGQVYAKEGRTSEAIAEFQTVLRLKGDFNQAHVDLGSAYADRGDLYHANEELKTLQTSAPSLATLLSSHINQVTPPKLEAAYSIGGFASSRGPGTTVASLDPALAAPASAQVFSMSFLFSKDMDAREIQNPLNWTMRRAQTGSPGGAYNWGQPAPGTEAPLPPFPLSVVYSADTRTATVSFLVRQNATATATLDPSHIIFRYTGRDTDGLAMDPKADEFGGLSKIV